MSFCNFIKNGINGVSSAHLRDQFQHDETTIVGNKGSFNGQARVIETDMIKEILIDGVVRVITVADAIRNNETSFWNHLRTNSLITFTITLISGVVTTAAAIAGAITNPSLWPLVMVVGFIALGILGFSFFALYRCMQATDQRDQWQRDRGQEVIQQRQQVGRAGFNYAYGNALKGTLVTDEEVKTLWIAKMDEYQSAFSNLLTVLNKVHANMAREFFNSALLNTAQVHYAFGDTIPQDIEALSREFQAINQQYTELRQITDTQKNNISLQKRSKFVENDAQRDQQLLPIKSWDAHYREPVILERGRVDMLLKEANRQLITARGDRNPLHQEVAFYESKIREYDSQLEKMVLTYKAMSAPVHALHAKNHHSIECWELGELSRIHDDEDKQLAHFLEPIQGLLQHYQEGQASPEVSESSLEELNPSEHNNEWEATVGVVDWNTRVLEVKTFRKTYI